MSEDDGIILGARMAGLQSVLEQRKEIVKPLKRKYNKIGRNELCFCGSGKKWKHCHMKAHQDKVNELERKDNGSTS